MLYHHPDCVCAACRPKAKKSPEMKISLDDQIAECEEKVARWSRAVTLLGWVTGVSVVTFFASVAFVTFVAAHGGTITMGIIMAILSAGAGWFGLTEFIHGGQPLDNLESAKTQLRKLNRQQQNELLATLQKQHEEFLSLKDSPE